MQMKSDLLTNLPHLCLSKIATYLPLKDRLNLERTNKSIFEKKECLYRDIFDIKITNNIYIGNEKYGFYEKIDNSSPADKFNNLKIIMSRSDQRIKNFNFSCFNHFGDYLEEEIFKLFSKKSNMLRSIVVNGTFPVNFKMIEEHILKMISNNVIKLEITLFKFEISDNFLDNIDLTKIKIIDFDTGLFESVEKYVIFLNKLRKQKEIAYSICFMSVY